MPRAARKWVRTVNSHLVTEFPKLTKCGRCGDTILLGHVAGMVERMDVQPLSPYGELEALHMGRRTYYIIVASQYLGERTSSVIRRELRPRQNGVVIRQHVCGTPRSQFQESPRRVELAEPTECPY